MIELDVNQDILPEDRRLPADLFEKIAIQINDHIQEKGTVAVTFLAEDEMQRFNRMYRGKDAVTDVLSFSYMHEPGDLLGDVALSYEQAARQAAGSVKDELAMLTVHGILHVFGHDHEDPADAKIMFPLQDKIVDDVLAV